MALHFCKSCSAYRMCESNMPNTGQKYVSQALESTRKRLAAKVPIDAIQCGP